MSQGSKLFVYGVNENCPREVLENEFGRCGEVTDVYNTGKGYAFVTMIDENAAQAAIRDLNGVSIDGGKPIKVDIAKRREDGGGGGRGGGYGGRGRGGGGYGGGGYGGGGYGGGGGGYGGGSGGYGGGAGGYGGGGYNGGGGGYGGGGY